ncbi:unnamed protein product [Clavelina lepadiformis]|uniref:Uncharacterized protein n=1 Tax=Clavelina lepadiformis TaxID=159417 RepID=A0ABP0GRG8_CLALP
MIFAPSSRGRSPVYNKILPYRSSGTIGTYFNSQASLVDDQISIVTLSFPQINVVSPVLPRRFVFVWYGMLSFRLFFAIGQCFVESEKNSANVVALLWTGQTRNSLTKAIY